MRKTSQGNHCGVGLICILILLLAGCGSSSQPSSGSSASWTDQVSAAQQIAHNFNPQATLIRVSAYPPPNMGSGSNGVDKRLLVDFVFSVPSAQQEMSVQILDTDPVATTHVVGPYIGTTEELTPDKIMEHQKVLGSVKLSPSEALEKTRGQGEAFAQKKKISVQPDVYLVMGKERLRSLSLAPDLIDKVSAVWSVAYTSLNPATQIFIQVDATTGDILGQEER